MPRKQRISPEDFARVLQGVEILGVDVDNFGGKLHDRAGVANPEEPVTVSIADKERFEAAEGEATVWHTYTIEVTSAGEGTPRKLLSLSVEFRVVYSTKEPFTKEFFDQFRRQSLRIQTLPYARSWVQDQCCRMGVPPLTIPLLRTEMPAARDGEEPVGGSQTGPGGPSVIARED